MTMSKKPKTDLLIEYGIDYDGDVFMPGSFRLEGPRAKLFIEGNPIRFKHAVQSLGSSAGGLIARIGVLRHVRSVELRTTEEPGRAHVKVKLRWYCWLTLGVLHLHQRRRIRAVIEKNRAYGVRIDLTVR
jgi:hypothetical protein